MWLGAKYFPWCLVNFYRFSPTLGFLLILGLLVACGRISKILALFTVSFCLVGQKGMEMLKKTN